MKLEHIFFACLALSGCSSAAPADIHSFEERACSVPSNLLSNPGFESGFTPWKWVSTAQRSSDVVTATVVTGGHNSNHAVQLQAKVAVGGAGAGGFLSHDFTICETGTYQLQWDIVQSKGKTTYDNSHTHIISANVVVFAPNSSAYIMGEFQFQETGFNSTYTAPKPPPSTFHPVSQWQTYKVSLPSTKTVTKYLGTWSVKVEPFIYADPKSTAPVNLKFLMDNFAVVKTG